MKKRLIPLLAALLAICLLIGFAGCGKEEPSDITTTEEATFDISAEDTTEPVTADSTATTSDTTLEAITGEAASEGSTEAEEGSLNDPTTLEKAALVEWYNERINFVRTAKPGMGRVEQLKITSFETSMGNVVNKIANPVVQRFMPGNPESKPVSKGSNNSGAFFTDMATSQLRASDVATATATKSGSNYVVTLTFGRETNPEKNANYKYYRAFAISTRQDVLNDLAGTIAAELSNTTMVYHSGKAVITVNPKGEIISANGSFKVDVNAKDAKIGPFTTDVDAFQASSNVYTNFVY